MKRHLGPRFVLLLRVAGAAWLGGALAWAALTLSGEVTKPRLVVVFMLVITAFCVMVAATLSAAPTVGAPVPQARPVSEPVPVAEFSPTLENQRPAVDNTWFAAAARDNAVRQARRPAPQAGPTDARRQAPDPPPTMVSIPVRPQRRADKGTVMPAASIGSAADVLIVQCPRCGDFGVEARARQPYFAFACRHCGHSWSWTDGSCWPTTVVRPRLAIAQGTGGSSTDSEPAQASVRIQAEPIRD